MRCPFQVVPADSHGMNRPAGAVAILVVLALLFSCSCARVSLGPADSSPAVATIAVKEYTYVVVASYPHDPAAFTQGLAYHDGVLYEGTGVVGKSSLRKVHLESGSILQSRSLPPPHFGEGITVFRGKVFQLTWQSGVCFVYDGATFEPVGEFRYQTEGWGLTHDGKRLIMSDGTATLYFLDPGTFEVTGRIEVRDERGPVTGLNELEYVRGEVYANVWQTDSIVTIAPDTGRVTGRINLAGLLSSEFSGPAVDCLNGIAYDPQNGRLFVTGKLWPRLYEIRVVPKA